jgi:PTS system nitrogen regulatory IIA component
MGDGVAIPHARIAGIPRLTGTFGRSWKGLDFGAPDGRPCHFFFALFVPDDAIGVRVDGVQVSGIQLRALARISSLLKERSFRDALHDASAARRSP